MKIPKDIYNRKRDKTHSGFVRDKKGIQSESNGIPNKKERTIGSSNAGPKNTSLKLGEFNDRKKKERNTVRRTIEKGTQTN